MPTSDYTPTVEDVAALLPARTRTRFNKEVGTFLPDPGDDDTKDRTRPTREQVVAKINEAVTELALNIGTDLPDSPGKDPDAIRKGAKAAAILLSGMNVELGYFADEIGTGPDSTYAALERRYNRLFPKLLDAISEAGGAVSGEEGGDGGAREALLPSYDFGNAWVTDSWERF